MRELVKRAEKIGNQAMNSVEDLGKWAKRHPVKTASAILGVGGVAAAVCFMIKRKRNSISCMA